MRHLGAILCAILLVVFAGYLLVATRACGLTTFDRWTIVACVAFALALAIPAQFKEAATTLASYVPLLKKNGGA